MDEWRTTVRRNWLYMLTATLLAVLLWVAVSADTVAQRTIPTDLVVYATDPAYVLTELEPPIQAVSVVFTGRQGDLSALSVSRPQILVSTDSVESPLWDVELTPDMVTGRGGRELVDVRAVSVRPGRLRLHFERRAQKVVPVVPRVSLIMASGFVQADSLRVDPPAVQVSGPEAKVENIDSVVTVPVVRERLRESISVEIPLEQPDPAGQVELSSSSVRVTVAVEPRAEQVFFGVPVAVRGADRADVVIEPSLVDVRISGPRSAVESVRSEMLTPLVVLRGPADGSLLPIQLPPLGPFIQVVIDPDSARVELVEEDTN